MNLADFNRLRAFMARTTSDADPEALTAIRMANRLLAENDLTWDKVFARTVKVIDAIETATPDDPAQENISSLIDEAEANATNDWEADFCADVRRKLAERGSLTEKQVDKLREIRDR